MPNIFNQFLQLPKQMEKPRTKGLTSVIDKGISIPELENQLPLIADFIDTLKLGFGTSALYDEEYLRDKIALIQSFNISVTPGGTLFEICWQQNKFTQYLDYCQRIGFDTIEISDGAINLATTAKLGCIKAGVDVGFRVFSEVGYKFPEQDAILSAEERITKIEAELDAGANKVICEARESGNLGIFDDKGNINHAIADRLFETLDMANIIFEAPNKSQQAWLINKLGPQVNLGNIKLDDIFGLQALRTSLRADTMPDTH